MVASIALKVGVEERVHQGRLAETGLADAHDVKREPVLNGLVLAVLFYSGGFVLFWRFCSILAVLFYSGGSALFWQCCSILAVLFYYGSLFYSCSTVLELPE